MDKLKFPEHICIVGKTGSEKSRLLGEILSRNVELYDRKTSKNIAVVVSPPPPPIDPARLTSMLPPVDGIYTTFA